MEERLPIPIKDGIPTIGLITFNSGRSFDFLHSIVNRGTIEYVYLERRGEEEQKEGWESSGQGEIFRLVEPSPLFERAFKASSLLHD